MKRIPHGKNFPHPPPDIIEGEQEWKVERIVSHKGKKNRQYQVKWQGYEEMTWEPEENLQHSQDSITDYWKRKAKKPGNQ
jgi:hypothetical protein